MKQYCRSKTIAYDCLSSFCHLLYQQHLGTFTEQGVNCLCNIDFGVILNAHSSNIRLYAEIN
jgi:hypothetical protein